MHRHLSRLLDTVLHPEDEHPRIISDFVLDRGAKGWKVRLAVIREGTWPRKRLKVIEPSQVSRFSFEARCPFLLKSLREPTLGKGVHFRSLLGMKTRSIDGRPLGKLKDLIIEDEPDADGCWRMLHVIVQNCGPVPAETIARIDQDRRVLYLNISWDQARNAPPVDPFAPMSPTDDERIQTHYAIGLEPRRAG